MGLAADIPYAFSGGVPQGIYLVIPPSEKKEVKQSTTYIASGGQLTSFFSTAISGESPLPKLESLGNKLTNIIDKVSACFNLTKEELASVCQVQSRKTLYNWIDGRQPRALTMERLFDLLMIAEAWKQSNFPNDYESLHTVSVQDISVIDMLKSDTLDKEKILFSGSRLALINSAPTLLKDPFA